MADEPLRLSDVLREEYVRLHGALPPETVAALDVADRALRERVQAANGDENLNGAAKEAFETAKLKALYTAIHKLKEPRTALCFSGGGIRSATFALGVMQRLASFELLTKFDYLSTVSGGGYIGSWLSSFVRREPRGMTEVQRGIKGVRAEDRNPLAPEIAPLVWLRRFSNYLTPKLGLMSADTWAFVGSYLRNLLLVWLMFVPFLAALLALPRLGIALLRMQGSTRHPTFTAELTRDVAALLILFGTAVIAWTRPVSYRKEGRLTNVKFLKIVLLPYVAGALLLVVYWAGRWIPAPTRIDVWYGVVGLVGINVLSSLIYLGRYFVEMRQQRPRTVRSDSTPTRYFWKKFCWEMIAATVAGLVGTGLLYAIAANLFNDPHNLVAPLTVKTWQQLPPQLSHADAEMYLCFALPLVLGVLFAQSAVFVALSSWFNEEYDREWWGRAAGWVLFAGVAWMVGTAITIYGPVAIYFAPKIYAALTAGTGLAAILGGKSGATGATDKEKDEKAGPAQTGINIGLGIVAPLFAIAILALISLCTSRILNAVEPPPRIKAREIALRAAGTYQIREATPFDDKGDGTTGRTMNFETSRFPAIDETHIAANEHLWSVDRTTPKQGLILVVGLSVLSWIVSFFIGANQFSMHGLYRNRLIRGYLGASQRKRRANAFSGFDPTDNLQMDRLRPEVFWPSTFKNVTTDGPKVIKQPGLKLEQRTKDAVTAAAAAPNDAELVQAACDLLAEDLNRSIDDPQVNLAPKPGQPQSVTNRLELERLFPDAFHKMSNHLRPLHLVNTTLNLVAGDDLAWQERKGAAFGISPLYSGNPALGYRPTRVYGGPAGVSLGTAVAISGAAASPNMGYNSSPALSFLLTLFNVRLGWWLGNPKKPSYTAKNPSNTLFTVLDEAFGLTDDRHDYVYLSDGGHFDNLGLYEMVLRRCRCIVVSDAGADPDFGFEDLGNAIRKIRIDLGVEITITHMGLFPRSKKDPSHPKYCAVAKIGYSQIDGEGVDDGLLLYLKPAFYGDKEPKDVYNYASTYAAFPHQSTGDQWFSESQFESYRQLGFFAAGEVALGEKHFESVCELIHKAERYIEYAGAEDTSGAQKASTTKYM
jgi:hypothetical protein